MEDYNYGYNNGKNDNSGEQNTYSGSYQDGYNAGYNDAFNNGQGNYGYQYEKIGGFFAEDIRAYVGEKKAEEYLHIFRRLERGEKPYRLLAGFFPAPVLIYRKMWKEALIIQLSCALLQKVCEAMGFLSSGIFSIAALVFFFGYIAREYHGWYWQKIRQDLTEMGLRDSYEPATDKVLELRKKGGTSVLGVVGILLLSSIVNSILISIFGLRI